MRVGWRYKSLNFIEDNTSTIPKQLTQASPPTVFPLILTGHHISRQWPIWIELDLAHNEVNFVFKVTTKELGQTSTGAVTIYTDVYTTAQ